MLHLLLLLATACTTPEPEPAPEPAPEPPPPPTYASQAEPPPRPALDPAREGAVYLRLARGVARLDGAGLATVSSASVTDLHRAPDGSVWSLSERIQRLDADEEIVLPEPPSMPRQLALDARGRAWIAHKDGVGRWDGAAWVSTPWADLSADEDGYAQDMVVDGEGVVWLSTLDGVYRFDGAWSAAPLPSEGSPPMAGAIRVDSDGVTLIASTDGTFRRSGGAWEQLDEVSSRDTFDAHGGHTLRAWQKTAFLVGPDGEQRLRIPDGPTSLAGGTVDAQGRAWLATDVGLYLLGDEGRWYPLGVDELRSSIEQLVASGAGPATLPEPPEPATLSVQAKLVQGGAPLGSAAVELCPQPQMLYRGESPCDGSAFRAKGKTDADGIVQWEGAARAPLRLTWRVGDEWKSMMGGDFRCCSDAQAESLDLGEVALPE